MLLDNRFNAVPNKVFFIIGASGSGKTTALSVLEKAKFADFKMLYFDSVGVPSLDEMQLRQISAEEWQRVQTSNWVKIIKETHLPSQPVILDGQTRPSFIQQACQEHHLTNFEIILFDCSDEVRRQRLIDRRQPELANEDMMNWAKYLREQSQQAGIKMLNNTHMTPTETADQLMHLLHSRA